MYRTTSTPVTTSLAVFSDFGTSSVSYYPACFACWCERSSHEASPACGRDTVTRPSVRVRALCNKVDAFPLYFYRFFRPYRSWYSLAISRWLAMDLSLSVSLSLLCPELKDY